MGREQDCFLFRKDLIKFTSVQPTKKTHRLSAGAGAESSLCSGCCHLRRKINKYIFIHLKKYIYIYHAKVQTNPRTQSAFCDIITVDLEEDFVSFQRDFLTKG